MSVLIFVILTLGYVHVSEPKEQLSLTDFLLDFLLSLWVPPNYAPSKFTRSIHDPTAKEQMISIEKSQIALDNYIKHLMRYARENTYSKSEKPSSSQEAQASSVINSNMPAYPCNEPYHGHYYTNFGTSLNAAESQTIIDPSDSFPNQIYDVQPYPYQVPNEEIVNNGASGIPNVNMCPPSGSIYSQYPFGCQTKRNVRWDEGVLGQYPVYTDANNNDMSKFAKRMWYPDRDNRDTKNKFNRFYGGRKNNPGVKDEVPEMSPSIPVRQTTYTDHMMSAQENIKKKVPLPKKGTKEMETRLFEDFYLPGFLDELGNNQSPQQITHPVYNFPSKYYTNQYADVTDSVVANRMLDVKLGNQGSLLNTMTRMDHQKTTPAQMDEPEKKIEKKSANSSVLPFTPTHRFGDIQTNFNKSEKEFALGHVIKPPEEKKR